MSHTSSAASYKAALSLFDRDPDLRVLRRVSSLDDFPLADTATGTVRRVAIVDTETTGLDALNDEIIDIAVVMVEVDAAGQILGIERAGQALRDPGMPIPPHITRLTGITDEDVRGKTIDLDRLERLLASADVRLAHQASFDLAFLEHLLPGLAGAAWACSAQDFDWLSVGADGCKLGHLLMQFGFFNTAHRAMADVISLMHVLARPLADGRTILGAVLQNAERPSLRIEATGAAFDKRGLLKARCYRWDPRARVWWTEIDEVDLEAETLWLQRAAGIWGSPRTSPITWHERHR